MTLAKRLAEIRLAFETGPTDQRIHEVLERHIQLLIDQNASGPTLAVGETAPLEGRVRFGGETVSLAKACGPKALILTWFRGTW